MLIRNKRNILIGVGLVFLILVLILFGMNYKSESIRKNIEITLSFNDNIEIEQDSPIEVDKIVKETNADMVSLKEGSTKNIGKQKIILTAKKDNDTKEFSITISVIEKKVLKSDDKDQESDIDKESTKENKKDRNDKKGDDQKDVQKQETSNAGSSTTSENHQNQGSSNNPSKDNNTQQEPTKPSLSESQYANQVFSLINTYRTSQGLSALNTNSTLQSIASLRANDMAQMGYASHSRHDGTVADMIWVESNYGITAGGEDVFGGSQGFLPEAVVKSFIDSPGHREPIMGDYNHYMAVGVRYSGGQVYVAVEFQQ